MQQQQQSSSQPASRACQRAARSSHAPLCPAFFALPLLLYPLHFLPLTCSLSLPLARLLHGWRTLHTHCTAPTA